MANGGELKSFAPWHDATLAAAFVLALHLLLWKGLLLFQPLQPPSTRSDPRMSLQLLPRPDNAPAPALPTVAVRAHTQTPAVPSGRRLPPLHDATPAPALPAVDVAPVATPSTAATGEGTVAPWTAGAPDNASAGFRKNLFDTVDRRFVETRPERFTMKRQITVKDVVRDFSRLLHLWPPGYTDDPCPAIRRAVDSNRGRTDLSGTEQAQLADAIAVRQQFCQ